MNSDLPQVQAQHTDVVKLVHGGIMTVLWVVDLRVDPGSLVVWVVNLLGLPLALLSQKENGFIGFGLQFYISAPRWSGLLLLDHIKNNNVDLVFWVCDHGRFPLSVHILIPVLRLLGIGVSDGLWLVPVLQDSRYTHTVSL